MSDWNSNQYMKFGMERTQPSIDLVNRLSGINPKRVLDIGCGPGNSTAILADRFSSAEIIGIDSSENMLAGARQTYPELIFEKCAVPNELDKISGKFDLIFSNACLHWIPEQEKLITAIFDKLNDGGMLAVQMPFIQNAEFYKLLYSLVAEEKWKKLAAIHNFHNLLPNEYYDLLAELSDSLNIWETTYYHILSSCDEVIEWYRGSGLRPYLDSLDNDEQAEFLNDLAELIKNHYPVRKNGNIILKMPRMFFTAVK